MDKIEFVFVPLFVTGVRMLYVHLAFKISLFSKSMLFVMIDTFVSVLIGLLIYYAAMKIGMRKKKKK